MNIKTERLTLLTVNKKMLKELIKKGHHKGLTCGQWPTEIVKDILNHDLKQFRNKDEFMKWSVWIIVLTQTGDIIGDAGFKGVPDLDGLVDLGYSILPKFRRKGYCFEATSALTEFALNHPLVEGITADCLKDNDASKKNLKNLGYDYSHDNESRFFYKKS